MCSVLSLVFVSFKASFVFGAPLSGSGSEQGGGGYLRASEIALFICSFVLAVGHIVVAYRTSCRERRKLWVYKIDIEAVSPPTMFSISPFGGINVILVGRYWKLVPKDKYGNTYMFIGNIQEKLPPHPIFVFIFGTQPTFFNFW